MQQLLATGDMPVRGDGTIDPAELARMSLEDMVNQIVDIQADELCGEGNRRNGCRERSLVTPVGEITLRIPKLREGTHFPDEIVRPYSRVDRAAIATVREACVRGMSTRKIEKAADALEFASLSPSRVSRMTAGLDEEVAALNARRYDGAEFPYLWLDATFPKCRDGGRVQSKGAVTAIACGDDGQRRFAGFDAVDVESTASWKAFLRSLRRRGLRGVRCVTSDDHGGLVAAVAEVLPGAAWQRRVVHLERDVAGWPSKRSDKAVALAATRATLAEGDPRLVRASCRRACEVIGGLSGRAGELLEDAEADALAYLDFPHEHHVRLRTSNVQGRASEETRRRTRVVGVFPSPGSLMRLVGSALADVSEEWMCGQFMDAASARNVCRDTSEPEPPSAEVVELARARIAAAIEERKAA